jgi:Protein of unknown function (DUF2934)
MARTQARSTPSASKKTESPAPEKHTAPPRNAPTLPTREQIARRAYELFLARGGAHGHHEQDWFQAERELKLGR